MGRPFRFLSCFIIITIIIIISIIIILIIIIITNMLYFAIQVSTRCGAFCRVQRHWRNARTPRIAGTRRIARTVLQQARSGPGGTLTQEGLPRFWWPLSHADKYGCDDDDNNTNADNDDEDGDDDDGDDDDDDG